jgi:type VI secretion system Hcp family effector
MAQNYYLKVDAIPGESTSDQGTGQIELLSWSHSVSMPISSGHASGVSVKHGRADFADLTISKYMDKTTPVWNQRVSSGENIATATLTIFQADGASGKAVLYYQIDLQDIIVTSYSVGAGGGDLPVETITLHFNQIQWTYAVQNKQAPGGNSGQAVAGWDLEKNIKL